MGQSLEVKLTSPDGLVEKIVLGADIKAGQVLQTVVKAGYSQTSRLLGSLGGPDCSLVGTAVSPGFEFEDWVEG
jgi:predicted cupin superfamily sugar epimerase